MAQEDFDRLVDDICKLKKLTRTAEMSETFGLAVDDVAFTLAPDMAMNGVVDGVAYFCNFGLLPDEVPHDVVLRRLLETNLFFFGDHMPRFTCNPETGSVMLVGRAPQERATAETMLQVLDQLAQYARQWGETYFLEDEERAAIAQALSGTTVPTTSQTIQSRVARTS